MVAAMFLFTVNDAMLKLAGEGLPVAQVMISRGLLATCILALLMRWQGLGGSFGQILDPLVAVRSLSDALASVLFVIALMSLPIATLTGFIQTVPVMSALVGTLVFREPFSRQLWISLVLCLVGVIALTATSVPLRGGDLLLPVAAIALMVLRDLVTRRTNPDVPSLLVAVLSTFLVPVIALFLLSPTGWTFPSQREAILIVGAGLAVGLGTLCMIISIRIATLAQIAPFRYTGLVFAILAGILLWGEDLSFLGALGAFLVILGGLVGLQRNRPKP